jgi:sigma-B regulation protein RsbU (phosphoserine phosphatase)
LRDRAIFAEQMVGIVSHDLRNPLSAILMGVQLLARVENERRTRVLGHVRDSAERAQRLIVDLLDFTQSRIGKGLSVKLDEIDLHEVAAHAIDELLLSFPNRQITHVARGEGYCVADADRLAQLIGNLVSNAATYGLPGTPIIVRTEIDGADATLSIENQGNPIPAEMIATLFEPMVRGVAGGNSTRSVGLGLFIVNEIAKSHGGQMELISSVEEGTRFVMRFSSMAPL